MSSLGSMMRQFSPPASSSLSSHFDLGQGVSSRKGSRDKRSIKVRAQRGGTSVSDDYAALGMSPAASRRDIKAAYRRLALQYHPDVCKEANCEHKFREINNAYEALMSRVQKGNAAENEELRWEDLFGESDIWDEWMGHEVGPIPTYAAAYSKSM